MQLISVLKRAALASCAVVLCTITGCKPNGDDRNTDDPANTVTVETPLPALTFNADSAYAYVARQVAFGPRTPGSQAQKDCAAWMQSHLRANCDTVYRQEVAVTGGDGKKLPCINLIGSINPAATRRYLLLAHWDSRPWADMDTKDKDKPIDAADDGASGVGVLLEMARQLKSSPLPQSIGVDILLVDVEDYGKTEWGDSSYCLGTQHWARNPHIAGYTAEGGILLDMVGSQGARFPQEQFSRMYARNLQDKIWETGNRAGFSSYFPYEQGGGVTDDHVFVNEISRIPTIDIIHLSRATSSGFPAHWHTHNDSMPIIDKNTLGAVGNTVLLFLRELAPAV